MKSEWDPELYLRFRTERTQPSIDLVNRIEIQSPASILDVGCGPGNSTRVLWERWPDADIAGLDSSETMIESARREHPDRRWILADVRELSDERYDLIYSNATIQWIPDHAGLLTSLAGLVKSGGALAVQIPLFREMPINHVIRTVASKPRWHGRLDAVEKRFTYESMEHYYDVLAAALDRVVMWQTWYVHEMESHEMIIDMMKSTGLRPYLDALSAPEADDFVGLVIDGIRECYPQRSNGRVLYPFRRLFFIGYRG